MPLKKGASYGVHPKVALSRPEAAKYLGAICVEWANAESMLAWIFSWLVLGVRQTQDGAETILMEAFDSVSTFTVRKDMLLVAAKRRFPQDIVDEFDGHLSNLWSAAKGRHIAAHGRWSISADPDYKDVLIWNKAIGGSDKETQVYGVKQLTPLLENISLASAAVMGFVASKMLPQLKIVAERYIDTVIKVRAKAPPFDKMQDET